MATSEQLLQEYVSSGNPICFRSLVDELGGMVYAVCLRITGDSHTAEDLSQDCFLELARKASTIHTSVPGWLHSTATNRALNLLRAQKKKLALTSPETLEAPVRESEDFAELQALIDNAVDQLDPQLRQIVIGHYLEGRSQSEVARRLEVDQSTVSRRLAQGLEEIRSHLRRMGILTSIAALMNVLGHSSAHAAPPHLTAIVAKIGLAGVGWTATQPSTWSVGLFLSTLAATMGNLFLSLICEGWLFALLMILEIAAFVFPPKWFKTALTTLFAGSDPWSHPAFPFKRWTWTVPPRDWKVRLAGWLLMGVVFNLVAFSQFANAPDQAIQPACMSIMGTVMGLIPAVRLGIRVWQFRGNLPLTAKEPLCRAPYRGTWEMVAAATAYVIMSISMLTTGALLYSPDEPLPWLRPVIMWGNLVGSIAFFIGAVNSRWTTRRNERSNSEGVFGDVLAPRSANDIPIQSTFMWVFLATTIALLSHAIFSATTSSVVLREQYVRMVPLSVVFGGGFALFSTIGFFSFLLQIRDHLVRWNFVFLLAVGIGLSAGSMTAVSYGNYLALTMPPPPEQSISKRRQTPVASEADVKSKALRKKYAREMSATAPRTLPKGFTQRLDKSHVFPFILEAPPSPANELEDPVWAGIIRRWLEQFEQPVPTHCNHVRAFIAQQYFKVVSRADKPVFCHTFVCTSPIAAKAIAAIYGPETLQQDNLVVIVFEKKGHAILTSNEQLVAAIRHQLESTDRPTDQSQPTPQFP